MFVVRPTFEVAVPRILAMLLAAWIPLLLLRSRRQSSTQRRQIEVLTLEVRIRPCLPYPLQANPEQYQQLLLRNSLLKQLRAPQVRSSRTSR